MIPGISQRKLLIAVIIQSEMPAVSKAAHSESIWNTKSSGTYQPIISDPVISTLISKQHVIWWVHSILRYSRPPLPDRSMCFLQLSRRSSLLIFFDLAFCYVFFLFALLHADTLDCLLSSIPHPLPRAPVLLRFDLADPIPSYCLMLCTISI